MELLRGSSVVVSWLLAGWSLFLLFRVAVVVLMNAGRVINISQVMMSIYGLCAIAGLLLALGRLT